MEPYFDLSAAARASQARDPSNGSKTALDQLLGVKSRVLRTKLDILSFEMAERLRIWDRNLERIDADKERVAGVMERISRL